MYMRIDVCVYIYIYIYIKTHTHTYARIIYTLWSVYLLGPKVRNIGPSIISMLKCVGFAVYIKLYKNEKDKSGSNNMSLVDHWVHMRCVTLCSRALFSGTPYKTQLRQIQGVESRPSEFGGLGIPPLESK